MVTLVARQARKSVLPARDSQTLDAQPLRPQVLGLRRLALAGGANSAAAPLRGRRDGDVAPRAKRGGRSPFR